ncbi:MAG: hypothetical protein GY953_20620, partial [bacterium]|nr:hypothetical protein [bacterium]
MSKYLPDERWFEALAAEQEQAMPERRAPARLKARVYSSLIRHQQASGQLESLPETKTAGQGLCVFEELVRITPVG